VEVGVHCTYRYIYVHRPVLEVGEPLGYTGRCRKTVYSRYTYYIDRIKWLVYTVPGCRGRCT